jgi:hypothetical protein
MVRGAPTVAPKCAASDWSTVSSLSSTCIGIYTKFPKRKSFQVKVLSSNSAQMNWVSHDNIIIFSNGYHAVFSGFFFG